MDRDELEELEKKALALLQRGQKGKGLELFQKEVDQVPSTGETLFLFGAVDRNNLQAPQAHVVVNEKGEGVDLKGLTEREGRQFFGGDIRPPWYQYYRYSYSLKYVYGAQPAADGCCCLPGVRTGIYATEINIHNFQNYTGAYLDKSVLPLILAGTPQGREPRAVRSGARDRMTLPAGSATMDDGCRINELLFGTARPTGQPLNVGFLEIVSNVELRVTAVYTATDLESRSVSLDVEEVPYRLKSYYGWIPAPFPTPWPELNTKA